MIHRLRDRGRGTWRSHRASLWYRWGWGPRPGEGPGGEVGSRVESGTIWSGDGRGTGQNGDVQGGIMPTETLIEEPVEETEESEELLVEEVSIDGLCGVY